MKYIVFAIIYSVLMAYKLGQNYFANREAQEHLLQKKWKRARKRRLRWKKEHRLYFSFKDPEYQKLWNFEICAEALYLLHINYMGINISWPDYKYEEEEYGHDWALS